MINLIVAMSHDGIIAVNGDLPWRVKEDMIHFKNKTINNICIMGRKTWDSIPKKPLKDRFNIVISRDQSHTDVDNNVYWYKDINNAMDFCKDLADSLNKNIWIIGGAEIYRSTLPFVTDLHITYVNKEIPDGVQLKLDIDLNNFILRDSTKLTDEATYKRFERIK